MIYTSITHGTTPEYSSTSILISIHVTDFKRCLTIITEHTNNVIQEVVVRLMHVMFMPQVSKQHSFLIFGLTATLHLVY